MAALPNQTMVFDNYLVPSKKNILTSERAWPMFRAHWVLSTMNAPKNCPLVVTSMTFAARAVMQQWASSGKADSRDLKGIVLNLSPVPRCTANTAVVLRHMWEYRFGGAGHSSQYTALRFDPGSLVPNFFTLPPCCCH